ncbi:MAG: TonB-dependent receptor, partial [Thermodesulfobacteriota bacterium]|nr:TonB-dependent receptor [Thermodesulfobacteriota bacterium]
SIRYGGRLGQDAFYRVYWKWFDRDHGVNASGHDAADDWEVFRGGFRIDWQTSNSDSLTFQGGIYEGDAGQTIDFYSLTPPYTNTVDEDVKIGGGNILARWSHAFSESSNLVLQTYYDSTQHHEVIGRLFHDIFDIEMQHRARLNDRHDITWGVGYRFLHDHIKGDFDTSMDPESRNHNLFGAFVQDEITLVKDFLRLTVGSKFEHNEFTGYEIQPGIRLAWTPDKGNTVWASVSHAVRTPSRGEHDGRIVSRVLPPGDPENPGPLPMEISLIGNHDFDSEELTAFELGYRLQPTDRLSWDIALFFNDYNSVFSIFYGDPTYETSPFPPHLLVPFSPENEISGEIYGIEVVSEWQALDWWRIETWYSYLNIQLRSHGLNEDVYAEIIEGGSPRHQISLRSSMDLPWHVEFDLWIRYTDNLTEQDVGSYVGLDARLCWKPREDIEFSLVGQNLFDDHHPEFVPEFVDTYSTEVEHSLYGKIKWRF